MFLNHITRNNNIIARSAYNSKKYTPQVGISVGNVV